MFTREYTLLFPSQARTLPPESVTDDPEAIGRVLSKQHDSGWLITGRVDEDYFTWVNFFYALHPLYGEVWGDFEKEVYAATEGTLEHFIAHHPYREWDYHDI